jgi:hypothetical protein
VATLVALLLPALACFPRTVSAQILPGGAAPPEHPGTRLTFGPTVGGAQLQHSFTTPVGRDVHYGYVYLAGKVQITVELFDGGRRVTAGSESPMVTAQFASDLELAEKAAKADGYTNFERPAVPSSCAFGSIVFRCIVSSALAQRDRVYSKMMLTGYNGYFVRIRATWSQGAGQTSADADKALQAFVPALIH